MIPEERMAAPNQAQQGMEALTTAMKANIVPDQEYLLQGSVLDSHLEVLNHRYCRSPTFFVTTDFLAFCLAINLF